MSSYASQLHEEQQAVDRAYGRLDDLRAEMWQRLDTVRAAGSHGSPTQRSERDSFATMYENRLTQLRSVEDRLGPRTATVITSAASACRARTMSRF